MRKAYALIYTMNSSANSQPMALSEKDLTEDVRFSTRSIGRHLLNGSDYFAEDDKIGMRRARVGFRILQGNSDMSDDTCLITYLDSFVKTVGGIMSFEVPTGRGKMDLLITHNQRKYIVETKIWRGTPGIRQVKSNSPRVRLITERCGVMSNGLTR